MIRKIDRIERMWITAAIIIVGYLVMMIILLMILLKITGFWWLI